MTNRVLIAAATLVLTIGLVQAQDLGTPVITPPILQQSPNPAAGLIVPPTAGPAQVAPQAAPAPAPAPAPAEPVAPRPAVTADTPSPRTMTSEQFDAWTLECFEPGFDGLNCQAILRVVAGDSSQVVLVLAVTTSSDGGTAVQMALPLGISIEAAVQIIVGSGYQNKIPLARCTPAGCLVEGTATPELLAALKRERSGIVVVEGETGEKIQLPFSLLGFTKAFDSAVAQNNQ